MSIVFGAVIVGDEILSGRRADKHLAFVAKTLNDRGLTLAWVRYIGDDPNAQAQLYTETLAGEAIVFSFGGIGATPDDHTRQAAATAAGVGLEQHSEATALIETKFGETAYPNRVKMAQLPTGSILIPNPINQVAGFSLKHHHFLPGFPEMAWPMAEWVLDHYYAGQGEIRQTVSFIVPDAKEGDLIDLMEAFVSQHPTLRFSSLPSYGNNRYAQPHIEFSVSGTPDVAQKAASELQNALIARGYRTIS